MGLTIKILKNISLMLTIVSAINLYLLFTIAGVILYSILESVNELEVRKDG